MNLPLLRCVVHPSEMYRHCWHYSHKVQHIGRSGLQETFSYILLLSFEWSHIIHTDQALDFQKIGRLIYHL